MADQAQAVEYYLSHEGFYSNNPVDPGGETIYGIARKKWPKWPGWAIVDAAHFAPEGDFPESLKHNQQLYDLMLEFYDEHFWSPNYSLIQDQHLLNHFFDLVPNIGAPIVTVIFQWALDRYSNQTVSIDGDFGQQTLDAMNAVDSEDLLVHALNGAELYYETLAEKNSKLAVFLKGWINRLRQ